MALLKLYEDEVYTVFPEFDPGDLGFGVTVEISEVEFEAIQEHFAKHDMVMYRLCELYDEARHRWEMNESG